MATMYGLERKTIREIATAKSWKRTSWSRRPLNLPECWAGKSHLLNMHAREWELDPEFRCMSDRVALITGAARGIGAATCRKFLDCGYRVTAVDLLEPTAELLLSHEQLHFRRCDVSDEGAVRETVEGLIAEEGRIDVLVNVAGRVLVKPLVETTFLEYEALVHV